MKYKTIHLILPHPQPFSKGEGGVGLFYISHWYKLQIGPSYELLEATVDSLKRERSIFKDPGYSAIGGLWIQLPFVNIGARYKMGLTNINAIDDKQTWKKQAIQIFAGFTF